MNSFSSREIILVVKADFGRRKYFGIIAKRVFVVRRVF